MSKQDYRLAGCDGKVAFRSMALAQKIARQAARRGEGKREAYHCKVCGMCHVGMPMREERGRPRNLELSEADLYEFEGRN